MSNDNCPFSDYRLEKLPKNSTCRVWDMYPATSSYWRDDTDAVSRCADWDTGGDRGGDSGADSRSGRGSGGGGGIEEMGDGPVTLETSEWNQYVIPALRELASIASQNDNAMTAVRLKEAADTLDDQSGDTRSLESQNGGDWGYVVKALTVISENASDDADAEKLASLADSVEKQAKGDDDAEGLPPIDRDELPQFDGFTIDMAKADDIRWVHTAAEAPPGYPASIDVDPSDVALTLRVYSHGGGFKDRFSAEREYSWLVRGERESDTSVITVAKTGKTAEDNRDRAIDAVERWVAKQKDDPKDVGSWQKSDAAEDELLRWTAEYHNPLTPGKDFQSVVIEEDEDNRGDTFYFAFHYRGDPDDGDRSKVASGQDKKVVVRETLDWLDENDPETFNIELPADVNGWTRTRLETSGLEHWDAVVDWEGHIPPTARKPDRRAERIRIFLKDGKYHVRYSYVDGDGEPTDSRARDLPTLPKNRSMSGRTSGRKKSFKNLSKPVGYAVEYMEDTDPKRTNWPDVPRFDLRTEVGDLKDIAWQVKRVVDRDSNASASLTVDRVNLVLEAVDEDNVSMFTADMLKDGFETKKANREAWEDDREKHGTAAFDGYALSDKLTDMKKSDSVWIRTIDPREPNDPVVLEVGQDIEIPLYPNEGVSPDLPDIDYTASFELGGVKELDGILKEGKKAYEPDDDDPDTPGVTFRAEGNRAFVWTGGNVEDRTVISAGDVDSDGETVATYSLGKLRDFTMSVPRPGSTTVEVEYAEDFPSKWFYRTNLYRMTFLMAPRIVAEQPEMPCEAVEDEGDDCPAPDEATLHEPLQAGETAPELPDIDWSGDNVLFTFPNTDGCRCGTQIQQLQTLSEETGTDVYAVAASPAAELAEMAEKYDLSITLISDTDGVVADAFEDETLLSDGAYERRIWFVRDGQITDVTDGMGVSEAELNEPEGCPNKVLDESDDSCPFVGYGTIDPPSSEEIESAHRYTLSDSGGPESLTDVLKHPGVYIVNGKRGSGKSSLAYTVADQLAEGRQVKKVAVGVPREVGRKFPGDWWFAESLEDVPNNSVVVIDEAYMQFNARTPLADENQGLAPLVNTSRHCDQTMLFVTQNTSALDRNAPAEADGILMKEPGTFHMRFERQQFKDLSETAKGNFDELPDDVPPQPFTYVFTDDYEGMVKTDEAEWYNDDISKSYAGKCGSTPADTQSQYETLSMR